MADTHPAAAAPSSKTDLFVAFTLLALQGFGGVLAVVQRELVEKRGWLTREQFLEDWAVAQIMPGPNVVNLSMMIGGRHFGLGGAMAALAGMLAAPLVVVLLLAALYGRVADQAWASEALRGMGAVAAGLITATGIKLAGALRHNAMGLRTCIGLCVLSFVAIALLRWPLVWVLLGLGLSACLWAYHRLGTAASGAPQMPESPLGDGAETPIGPAQPPEETGGHAAHGPNSAQAPTAVTAPSIAPSIAPNTEASAEPSTGPLTVHQKNRP